MAAAAKKRGSATARDMMLSLAVVGVAIGLFVLLLPRTAHQKVNEVEYLPAARALAADTTRPILVPAPLPTGWQANYVRVGVAESLHVGFVLDSTRFAQIDETARPDAAFYRDAKVSATPGVVTRADAAANPPAGYDVRRQGRHVALVRKLAGGGVLTISDGGATTGASLSELITLARSVREIGSGTT